MITGTIVLQNKREIIDLKGDTFRTLSIMAAEQGTNLKNFIEWLLDHTAQDYDDSEAYAWLVENVPEGRVFISDEEQAETEKWLGIWN